MTKEQAIKMRGIAILMICLHNLLHLSAINPLHECEFSFNPEMVNMFLTCDGGIWTWIKNIFSFLGWYGVAAFMFFSGYGLVCKHEIQAKPIKTGHYLLHNFLKLFVLMAPVYCIYVFCVWKYPGFRQFFYQLTMTINFVCPQKISPGVYWYFGLTMQFYIFYLLFYHFRNRKWLYTAATLALLAGLIFAILPQGDFHIDLRHNSPLWLPIFLFGIWFARGGSKSSIFIFMENHRALSTMAMTLIWLISSLNRYLWVFSPLFLLVALILLFRTSSPLVKLKAFNRIQGGVNQFFTFIGSISAGIFVCHPLIRTFALSSWIKGRDEILITIVYSIITILVSFIYMTIYKKVMPWILKCLHIS